MHFFFSQICQRASPFNRVHLHCVLVLFYSVCRSVNVLSGSFNSFTYVLRLIILDVTKRRRESARESERRYQLLVVPTIRKEEQNRNIWLWLVCC